jgi:hypothetical protein
MATRKRRGAGAVTVPSEMAKDFAAIAEVVKQAAKIAASNAEGRKSGEGTIELAADTVYDNFVMKYYLKESGVATAAKEHIVSAGMKWAARQAKQPFSAAGSFFLGLHKKPMVEGKRPGTKKPDIKPTERATVSRLSNIAAAAVHFNQRPSKAIEEKGGIGKLLAAYRDEAQRRLGTMPLDCASTWRFSSWRDLPSVCASTMRLPAGPASGAAPSSTSASITFRDLTPSMTEGGLQVVVIHWQRGYVGPLRQFDFSVGGDNP